MRALVTDYETWLSTLKPQIKKCYSLTPMPPRKATRKRKSQPPPPPRPLTSEPLETRPSSPLTSLGLEHSDNPRPASPLESVRSPMTCPRSPPPHISYGPGQESQFLVTRPSLMVAITPFEEDGIDFLQWKP